MFRAGRGGLDRQRVGESHNQIQAVVFADAQRSGGGQQHERERYRRSVFPMPGIPPDQHRAGHVQGGHGIRRTIERDGLEEQACGYGRAGRKRGAERIGRSRRGIEKVQCVSSDGVEAHHSQHVRCAAFRAADVRGVQYGERQRQGVIDHQLTLAQQRPAAEQAAHGEADRQAESDIDAVQHQIELVGTHGGGGAQHGSQHHAQHDEDQRMAQRIESLLIAAYDGPGGQGDHTADACEGAQANHRFAGKIRWVSQRTK